MKLNVSSKVYGGRQQRMKTINILQEKGYLGKYTLQINILSVSGSQSIFLSENDDGPMNLIPVQRLEKIFDKMTGPVKIKNETCLD